MLPVWAKFQEKNWRKKEKKEKQNIRQLFVHIQTNKKQSKKWSNELFFLLFLVKIWSVQGQTSDQKKKKKCDNEEAKNNYHTEIEEECLHHVS